MTEKQEKYADWSAEGKAIARIAATGVDDSEYITVEPSIHINIEELRKKIKARQQLHK